ncbi:MAG: hypothetical protein V3T31_09250, partial [candidate division Zixibacteria bacterium]
MVGSSASGQFYFGKNKVNYARFDWRVMTTEHFRIYYYSDETEIASIAAQSAEDSYEVLSAKFNHEVLRKIPLIIYSAAIYFSQTNVTPSIIPESVAGFTEFLKGRVVVPFHGSYSDFDHVIRHELVHVFTISKLSSVTRNQARIRYGYPPLWFIEGLAEFWSEDWDTEADMIVKDMVVSGNLPSIREMIAYRGTYFMYKLGQSICSFIDREYGSEKLLLLFENWHKGRNFTEVIQITLGEKLSEVSRKWAYSLKKKYFPEIDRLDLPQMRSERMTPGGFAVKAVPIRYDDGDGPEDWIIFKANRMGYSGIYMKRAEAGKGGVRTLLKGERSARFESLYLLRSGIDANGSGRIVFSSRSKARDVIYLYELSEGKVTRRYELPDLIAARSPRLSPDGTQILFSGIRRSGFADIYLLEISSGDYRRITDDIYYDITPTFTLDGLSAVFTSDRGAHGSEGALNLYQADLLSGEVTQLTSGRYIDQTPEVTEDGIYFSSDREGSYNLFLLEGSGNLTRQSTYVTGAFDPRVTPDDEHLMFTGFEGSRFQIYRMEKTDRPEEIAASDVELFSHWYPEKVADSSTAASIKYDTDYSFDIAQTAVVYDPVYGSAGGFQAALSDVLGNHAYHLFVSNTARTNDEILTSFNAGVTYINKEQRLNWGVGAFHLFSEHFNEVDQYFDQRQAGVVGLISYPFSKFHRIEFSAYARYSHKDRRFGLSDREDFPLTNYSRWVFDNSLWEVSGPIEGRRYSF